MAQADKGKKVKVHYTGKLDDGTVFDSSEGREPLEFVIGSGQVIPGFEKGILGLEEGDAKTINILAEEAYGPYREDMMLTVDKSTMPEGADPQLGMQLEMKAPSGQAFVVTIAKIEDEKVTLDGNHPLAGKDLTFDLTVVSVS